MSAGIDLSIIIPAYREAATIGARLEELAAFLETRDYGDVEVVVVTARCPDGTHQVAQEKASLFRSLRVVEAGQRVGKGRDVRVGMFTARGRYKLFMDADFATPLSYLDQAYLLAQSGSKLGIAVRDLWVAHDGLARKLVSWLGNRAVRAIALPDIPDSQCGFKIFESTAADEMFLRQTMMGWSFDVEILVIAKALGYQADFIFANDWKDPKRSGLSGDSLLRAGFRSLVDLFVIRRNLRRGHYLLGATPGPVSALAVQAILERPVAQ